MKYYKWRNTYLKKRWMIVVSLLVLVVLFNEHWSYRLDSLRWPESSCSGCTKILLVADPQILGPSSEPFSPFWMDADPFISKSFNQAYHHVNPDVIIFLGDLMDEGSQASDSEYKSYKSRFQAIFQTHPGQKFIYIPGDNDIGGEGNDRLTQAKVDRFDHNFPSPTETLVGNISFVTVDRISSDFKVPTQSSRSAGHQTRVVISHIPLTFMPGIFSREVMNKLKPHLIFSAHEHRTALAITRLEDNHFQVFESFEDGGSLFQHRMTDQETIEIIWPTCSYRMGVANAGYGFAAIGPNGDLEAGVLWIHSRFKALLFYLFILTLCLIILLLPSRWF